MNDKSDKKKYPNRNKSDKKKYSRMSDDFGFIVWTI